MSSLRAVALILSVTNVTSPEKPSLNTLFKGVPPSLSLCVYLCHAYLTPLALVHREGRDHV